MPSILSSDQPQLPLFDSLEGLRRRIRMLSILFGIGVVLAATVGLLGVTVLLDYLLNLRTGPRLVFIAGAAAGIVYALWAYLARPLAARLTNDDVAGRLENAFPEFGDRLRSTVGFAAGEIPGSPTMQRRVMREAGTLAATMRLDDALLRRPPVYSLAAGLGAAALVVVLSLIFTDFARTALSRLLVVNAMPWPKRVEIQMLNDAPATVMAGQRMELRMRLAKGDGDRMKPVVHSRTDDRPAEELFMRRQGDGSYAATIEARGAAMSVWLTAGDDQTAPRPVRVVKRMAVNRVEALITPPGYVKAEPFTVNLTDSPGAATEGSGVSMVISFNKPLAAGVPVALEPAPGNNQGTPSAMPPMTWTFPSPNQAVANWTAREPVRFRISAVDVDEFAYAEMAEYELLVRPDAAPGVSIEAPRGDQQRTPQGFVDLQALAEDDFGISTMTLIVHRTRDEQRWAFPLSGWSKVEGTGQYRRFRAQHRWELSDLSGADLRPGDVLEYHVEVTDNYDYNGATHPPVPSGKLRIHIISQEDLGLKMTERIARIHHEVEQTLRQQASSQRETGELREMLTKRPADTADKTALDRLQGEQRRMAERTGQNSRAMEEVERTLKVNRSTDGQLEDIAESVAEMLGQAARDPMPAAAEKLGEAGQVSSNPQQSDPARRDEALRQSEKKQQEAKEKLAEATAKMASLDALARLMQAVQAALDEQRKLSGQAADMLPKTLGKKPEELSKQEKDALEKLAEDQRKAAEKTAKLQDELAAQAGKSKPAKPGESTLEKALKHLKENPVDTKQGGAGELIGSNRLPPARRDQREAELGLERVLDALGEEHRWRMENLVAKRAELEELIAHLVRRQAGHNIDNLQLQGPRQQKLITPELLAKSERKPEDQRPPPEIGQLSRSQGQTEANARDIAREVSAAPHVAEIAAALERAARHMERAIVTLRERNLGAAFDPSQALALQELEEAAKLAADAARKAEEDRDDAERENVRKMLEAVRRDQHDDVNQPTAAIDTKPRASDGGYRREDGLELRRLAGEQSKLGGRMGKVEEHLKRMEGIVYVWASREIIDVMKHVESDLSVPSAGPPTQIEQQHIVEQLDAMIANLKAKPPVILDDEGRTGGPGVPTETELRLLRQFQLALNKSTAELAKLPQPVEDKSAALGRRQLELREQLDRVIKAATRGGLRLGPKPSKPLPEESDDVELLDEELEQALVGERPAGGLVIRLIKGLGDRMGRSGDRLAEEHDAGKITQSLQERIALDLDQLIELMGNFAGRSNEPGGNGATADAADTPPDAGDATEPGNEPGGTGESADGGAGAVPESTRRTVDNRARGLTDIRETSTSWARLTPRQRQAIIEGASDSIVGKYERLIREYYESLGQRTSAGQRR